MGTKNVVRKQTNTKKKRTYNRKCGICGVVGFVKNVLMTYIQSTKSNLTKLH